MVIVCKDEHPLKVSSLITVTDLGITISFRAVHNMEWWNECARALRTDDEGNRSLVFYLSGSPLSGANCCAEVYEDGRIESVSVHSFIDHWRPFMAINQRYTEAKHMHQAYTLQQVLDILHAEDSEG